MTIRNGPTTKNSGSVRIGLMKILAGLSVTYIDSKMQVLDTTTNSLGALAQTKYTGDVEWWDMYSGYPQQLDAVFPIKESASIECAFLEQTPWNLALAHGLDPTAVEYASTWSGEIALGARVAPAYLRVEGIGTYPDGTHQLNIIFPKAQVKSSVEMEDQTDQGSNTPCTIHSTPADSGVTDGNAIWDDMPLGRIYIS